MILLLILLFIIIIAGCYYWSKSGSAELVENKTLLKSKVQKLGYANFSSFIEKKALKNRLICIVGADHSGRTHLANMISKKYGHKMIKKEGQDIPKIRQEFYIEGVKIDMSPADKKKAKENIEKSKHNKFVIVGNFNNEDLSRLFKGKGYNRNFLLIFVQPKVGLGLRWSKVTGLAKTDYEDVLKKSDEVLKGLKEYRVYILHNEFDD